MIRPLFLCAALVLTAATAVANAADAPRYVSVQGEGTVETVPDMAEIATGVTARAETARQALDTSSAAMRRLMAALRKAGVAEADIRTSQFNVSPWYEPPAAGRQRRIAGYQATNQVTARIRDLARLGTILDAVVTAGANRVNNVRFGVAEPRNLMDEARRKAVVDARRRAALYAESAGVKLGAVLSIEEQAVHVPRPRAMALEAVRAASVPVSPGTEEVTATVSVRFALE